MESVISHPRGVKRRGGISHPRGVKQKKNTTVNIVRATFLSQLIYNTGASNRVNNLRAQQVQWCHAIWIVEHFTGN